MLLIRPLYFIVRREARLGTPDFAVLLRRWIGVLGVQLVLEDQKFSIVESGSDTRRARRCSARDSNRDEFTQRTDAQISARDINPRNMEFIFEMMRTIVDSKFFLRGRGGRDDDSDDKSSHRLLSR